MATVQEAQQALGEKKVVLADWAGRRVTINDLVQSVQTGQWAARWSHSDFPGAQWSDIDESQEFIIRGEYGRYR